MAKKGAPKKKGKGGKKKGYDQLQDEQASSSQPRRSKRRGKNKHATMNSAEDRALRHTLTGEGKYEIIDMAADGNCLFRSLSDQLHRDHGDRHDEIRHNVCDYLVKYEEEFSVFLVLDEEEEDEDASDFASYVTQMRDDGEWGGNLELVATARLYRRNIRVFSTAMPEYMIEHGDKAGSSGPDLLVSYHDNDHYNSVRDTKMSKVPSPVKSFVRSSESDAVEKQESNEESIEVELEPKKTDPCPCGSRKKYQKCCLKKKNHARRTKNEAASDQVTPNDDKDVNEMTGDFTVLNIDI